MRVWAFPSFYPYDHPGHTYAGIFAHRQYKGLIENGADLSVIYPVPWHPVYPLSLLHADWKSAQSISFPRERVYDGIKVFQPRIPDMKPSRFVRKTYEERYVGCIVNFFKKNNIVLNDKTDVFYSQWLPSSRMVQIAAHKLGVKSGILYIGDDVVLWPNSGDKNKKYFDDTLREADFRFSCADYLGRMANDIAGKDYPFDVVRWGVDYDFFKPTTEEVKNELRKVYNIPANKVVILNIGTASPRKGWLDLFDALVEIKKQNSNFLVAAVHTGKKEFSFAEEITNRGLSGNFLDIGEVPPHLLDKVYNMSDIFCLPSHSEGLANVAVEAMSAGLPVITTLVGGHAELITNDVNGILIPPQKPQPLYDKLSALINSKELRKQLGAAARQHIVNDWGNYKGSTKLLYERLCSR